MPKPTIVLVHGAWADASSWNAVASELQSQGYTVLAPPNLLRAVPVDAPYITSFLAQRTSGPVLLVGHSYGGFVITNAAVGADNVKALVYVDAFIPDEGETRLPDPRRVRIGLRHPRPDRRLRPRRLPGRAGGRRRGVPQARHRAQLLRPGPPRVRPLADRGGPAADHPERQHDAVRARSVEDPSELGRDRHRGPRDPAGHAAPHGASARARRSPRWPARTSRWCPIPKSRSTRSWRRAPRSATKRPEQHHRGKGVSGARGAGGAPGALSAGCRTPLASVRARAFVSTDTLGRRCRRAPPWPS